MKIKSTLIIVLAIFYYSQTHGQLTLQACHKKARTNYPLIKQYELIEKTQEYSLSNANKAYLPQFNITAIAGLIEGMPQMSPGAESSGAENKLIGIAQLNQVIWDGGMTRRQKEIITASAEVETAQLEIELYAVNERVNNLFFGILLIEEQLQQTEILKTDLERGLKIVQSAYENGSAHQTDIMEIQAEVINIEQKLAELFHAKNAYKNMLEILIGDSINTDNIQRPSIEQTTFISENTRPEMQLFENQRKLVEAQSKMINAKINPKLGFLGAGLFLYPEVTIGQSEMDHLLIAGFSLSWNIGGLYTKSNDRKLIDLNTQKINLQQETFLYGNNLQLTQNISEAKKYKAMLKRDQAMLDLKTKIRKSYEVKYQNGVCTMTDLLQKINDESRAKQQLSLHEVQYLMAMYEYKYILGK